MYPQKQRVVLVVDGRLPLAIVNPRKAGGFIVSAYRERVAKKKQIRAVCIVSELTEHAGQTHAARC